MKAKELAEESERKETLDFIINEYNSDVATDTSDNSFTNFLAKMKEKGKIEDFIFYGDNLIIKYDGYYYEVVEEDDYYKISKKMTEDLGSTGGTTKIVTPDNIKNAENGNVSFEDGDEFIILDNVTVDNFNFIIPAKATVTIKLLGDMKIDNKNTSNKSAIDLGVEKEKDGNGIWQYKNGATLNLYVYGKVEVNSSFGEKGEDSQSASTSAAKGGPRSKSRNKSTKNSNFKFIWNRRTNSNRRGCWKRRKYSKWYKRRSWTVGRSRSWNRTEMDGDGGNGCPYTCEGRITPYDSGEHGGTGEDCGTINIYDELKVYAFGGKGGNGGISGASSGRRRWRLSCSWNWPEVALAEAGGDHISGGRGLFWRCCSNRANCKFKWIGWTNNSY